MFDWVPEIVRPWAVPGGIAVVAVVLAWIAHAIVYFIADRITRKTPGVADTAAVGHTRAPARLVLILLALQVALPALRLEPPYVDGANHLLVVALILSVTWLVIRAIASFDDVILSRYPVDVQDNLLARKVHTQTKVLTRSAMIIVAVCGIAAAVMTFPMIRQLGASLLASAGIAGIVMGLAARPALSNLIAGIQLALSQPIRIDDVVIVEGEWGRIEEITATFVVVRIWDERRLVVPLQRFIEQPFQNWTRTTADILGTVFIYVDYTVPVEAVRAELKRIVEGAAEWDGRICGLQVTDATDQAVQLRALVSASDASKAWDLRCLVREKLVAWLQREHPGSLPRTRAEVAVDTSGSATRAG